MNNGGEVTRVEKDVRRLQGRAEPFPASFGTSPPFEVVVAVIARFDMAGAVGLEKGGTGEAAGDRHRAKRLRLPSFAGW